MLLESGECAAEYYDVCVVGGGPGGMLSATLLAEKGLRVLMIERGNYTPQKDTVPFTASELRDRSKYTSVADRRKPEGRSGL